MQLPDEYGPRVDWDTYAVSWDCAHELEDGSGVCHAWKYQNIIDGRLYEYGHHSCLTFAQKDQP